MCLNMSQICNFGAKLTNSELLNCTVFALRRKVFTQCDEVVSCPEDIDYTTLLRLTLIYERHIGNVFVAHYTLYDEISYIA